MEANRRLHAPAALPPGKAHGTRWIGDWMGSRDSLDAMSREYFSPLAGIELGILDRPARSPSLYGLSYPGSVRRNMEYKSSGNAEGNACLLFRIQSSFGGFTPD
jgi:hypothetical protein